jgi:hypothetical protein
VHDLNYKPDKGQNPYINILFQFKGIDYTNVGVKSAKNFSSNTKLRKKKIFNLIDGCPLRLLHATRIWD